MKNLTIKQLFYILVFILTIIPAIYIYINNSYIKSTTQKALNLKSINHAYIVAKKLIEMNDLISYKYRKEDKVLHEALQISQDYVVKNGKKFNLEPLKKELNKLSENARFDILIIDEDYVIRNTTYKTDMNLDFRMIPLALKTLKKVYSKPGFIDVSTISGDAVSNEYKQYIVQRAKGSKNFLVQVSMSLVDGANIENFIKDIKNQIPNLLSSKVYYIPFDKEEIFDVEVVWSQNFTNYTKMEMLKERDSYDKFIKYFDDTNKIRKSTFIDSITAFLEKNTYKDLYSIQDEKYIHHVMLPFNSFMNISTNSRYMLYLEFDESQAKATIDKINILTAIIWLVLALLVVVTIYLVNRRIIKPIELLKRNMKVKKSIDMKLLDSQNDEISSMSFTYNQLLQDLKTEIESNEELLEQFKTFTANTIHQVRTPVSIIKIALEMIDTTNQEALLQIKASLVSIEHMYDSLSYTLNRERISFEKKYLDISSLLQQRINLFSVIVQAHDSKIEYDIEPNIMINMNQIEAEYLIDNNLSNAIKYSTPKKDIQVRLHKFSNDIKVSFESYGTKIEDTKIIFERYHRTDKSRRGNGIGLHMVGEICKANDILIEVEYINEKNKFSYFFDGDVTSI